MSKQYSVNERAEKLVGLRAEYLPENAIIFDFPCELGYHCPVCKYELVTDGEYDERLEWSEYQGFIWCRVCDKDYPSALCMPDIDKAIETYLDTVEQALRRANPKPTNGTREDGDE